MEENSISISNYLTLSRKFFENELWKEERVFSKAEAWLDLIREARYLNTTGSRIFGSTTITWERGQVAHSLRFLADRWGWSTKKVNNFLGLLKGRGMVELGQEKETRTTIITLCKYDTYNLTAENGKRQGNAKETPRKRQGNKTNKENIDNKDKYIEATPQPLPLPLEKTSIEIEFEKFNEWLSNNAPQVLKMAEPITAEQFQKLKTEFADPALKELMKNKLCAMHNKKDLLKKYTSANLTLREWIRMGREAPVIKLATTGGKSVREQRDEELLRQYK